MSSIVIDDLRRRFPQALILFAYNRYTTQLQQTNQLLFLNFLSQLLERHPETARSDTVIKLHDQYKIRPQILPPHEEVKSLLRDFIRTFSHVFIVIDALDEFCIENNTRTTQLLRELEAFDSSLFVTSRSDVSFAGDHATHELRASTEDVRAFVRFSVESGNLATVLEESSTFTTQQVIDKIVGQADGMFLAPSLQIRSMERCEKVIDVKNQLARMTANLDATYQTITQQIQQQEPWAMSLIYHLLLADNYRLGTHAMLQYLAFEDMEPTYQSEDNIEDHLRPIAFTLRACRGLVRIVEQEANPEDFDLDVSMGYRNKSFEFCHMSVREYVSKLLQSEWQSVKTNLVSLLLCFMVYVFDKWPQELYSEVAQQAEGSPVFGPSTAYLRRHYPLLFHCHRWTVYAQAIQHDLQFPVVDAYFQHPKSSSLLCQEDPACGRTITAAGLQTIHLATHGLDMFLGRHLARSNKEHLDLDAATVLREKCWKTARTALIASSIEGYSRICHLLVRKGASVDQADGLNLTPLQYAISRGHWGVVECLLEGGASLYRVDERGQTPLMFALEHAQEQIVSMLLEKDACLGSLDIEGRTSLGYACKQGYQHISSILIARGSTLDVADLSGQTPLFYAARRGHLPIVTLLLEKGADPDIRDQLGKSPLYHALETGHVNVASLLIRKDAAVNSSDLQGRTSLNLACKRGYLEIVTLLLEKGAYVDSVDEHGRTPLNRALKRRSRGLSLWQRVVHHMSSRYRFREDFVAIASLLLDHGAVIDSADKDGRTPLSHAADSYEVGCVQLLLERGASVFLVDKKGRTPLSYACQQNTPQIVNLLLEYGARVDEADNYGQTPLVFALQARSQDILQTLLSRGASVHRTDDQARSPLFHASQSGWDTAVALLLARGAAVDQADSQGRTPLMAAVTQADASCVRVLLGAKANVGAADCTGKTPLLHAVEAARPGPIQQLIEAGADPRRADSAGRTSLWYTRHLDLARLMATWESNERSLELRDPNLTVILQDALIPQPPLSLPQKRKRV